MCQHLGLGRAATAAAGQKDVEYLGLIDRPRRVRLGQGRHRVRDGGKLRRGRPGRGGGLKSFVQKPVANTLWPFFFFPRRPSSKRRSVSDEPDS